MSVVGVDFGTLNTVIAVARNRGVDVITNEVSNRATPSLVGFGPKSRYLGEAAKTQEISNLKNTVSSLKRLAGRQLKDPDMQIEQQFISAPLVDVNGQVGAEVTYQGRKERFSATQLIGMYLSKIKQTTANEIRAPVSDLVMSVPAWFTDVQRRSLIDAAEIAGLKLLRLINDTTAAALGYGITKLDLPSADEKPRRVVFVDVGHSNYTASVIEFRKGELTVKATAYDRHFGGRNFDKAIVDHLQKEFLGKYKIDIFSNPRAVSRVLAAAERLKKILSANQQAPLNIESLMNDIDVRAMITRQEFEALVEPLLVRATAPLEQALADAGLTKDDIDIIEVVGGGSRVPAIKERIQSFFGKPLSFTLNQDEAIARGCAFSCAIMSPIFRVRDFAVHDVISYPIEFSWEKANDIPDEDPNLVVFGKGNVMPSTKVLTFFRKRPFDIEARYYSPQDLPAGIQPFIARFSVKGVKPTIGGPDDYMTCKLRARVNINGVLNVESAYYVEDQEIEEEVKEEEKKDDAAAPAEEKKDGDVSTAAFDFASGEEDAGGRKTPLSSDSRALSPPSVTFPKRRRLRSRSPRVLRRLATTVESDDDAGGDGSGRRWEEGKGMGGRTAMVPKLTAQIKAMDTDAPAEAKPKVRKVRKQVRKGDLPIVSATQSLDATARSAAFEKEAAMVMDDKLVADTEEKKNELETYIYELRNKLDDQYADFASDEEKEKLRGKLSESEDWLYDEGEDATKAIYVAKMDEIRSLAGPIVQRHFEHAETQRQALQAKLEAEAAAKKAANADKKAAGDEAGEQPAGEGNGAGATGAAGRDEDMADAEGVQSTVEEVDA